MKYKNGRLAKEGDHVVAELHFPDRVVGGVVHNIHLPDEPPDAPALPRFVANISVITPGVVMLTAIYLDQCLHVEDALTIYDAVSKAAETAQTTSQPS